MASVAVIIATLDRGPDLIHVLEQITIVPEKMEVIIVDQTVQHDDLIYKKLNTLVDHNSNFYYYKQIEKNTSIARNFGAKQADADYLIFIDDDVIIEPDFFTKYINYISENSSVDAIAGMVLNIDNTREYSLPQLYKNKYIGHLFRPMNYAYKIEESDLGTCNMLIKKSVFTELDGFDPQLLRLEDSDFATRFLKAGYKSVYDPGIFLIHKGTPTGASRHLTSPGKTDVYWAQCFYMVMKNFGLSRGWRFIYYYAKPYIIRKGIFIRPKNYFLEINKIFKGYLMARKTLSESSSS